jgi:TolA-binding protein
MSERNVWPGIIAILFVIGLFVWLLAQARHGDRMAIAVLAAMASVVLILIGWGFSTLTSAIHARREQQHFMNNMRENLAIMETMQKVQNQQNVMLMRQAKETQKALSGGNMPALPLPSQEQHWLPALTEFEQPSEVADGSYRVAGEEEWPGDGCGPGPGQ